MATTKKKKTATPKKAVKKDIKKAAKKESVSEEEVAQEPANRDYIENIVRYIIGFFAIFLVITFFESIDSGILGGVRDFLKGVFGFGYYLFPVYLLIFVWIWGKKKKSSAVPARLLILTLDFVFLLVIIHMISVKTHLPETGVFDEAVKAIGIDSLYTTGQSLSSAGVIGGFLCAGLSLVIGWVATLILAIVGIFVCTVLVSGSTPAATIKAIGNFFRNLSLAEKETGEDEESEEDPEIIKANEKNQATVKEATKKSEPKHKIPSVLITDEKITDENRKAKIISPEEEDEEVFQHGDEVLKTLEEDSTPSVTNTPEPVAQPKEAPASEPNPTAPAEVPAEEKKEGKPSELPKEENPDESLEVTEETETLGQEIPYVFPPVDLLTAGTETKPKQSEKDFEATSRKLEQVLDSFKVKAKVVGYASGPAVTRYEVLPESGVRVKQIANLSDDIALHLAATSVRIENIPGKSAIGIEVPNSASATVRLRKLIEDPTFQNNKSKLVVALGEDVSGSHVYLDIGKMPHLLIAGATGQGKSVCMNSMIISLIYHASPQELRMIMIDPKKVEMAAYNGIPHLLVPVVNDAKKAAGTLNWACVEMENRYSLIQEVGAKNLADYNAIVKNDPERKQEPYIVIFIDELADLMLTAPDDVETSICRLAQKARAAGIHLVIGTQRPSVDVITGLIKANIPSRIAFTVVSSVDSRTILDSTGAEKLLGRGDMLFNPVGAMKPIRVQGAFLDDKTELVAITEFVKQAAVANYDEKIVEQIEKEAKLCGAPKHSGQKSEEEGEEEVRMDDKFLDALELAIDSQNISTSMIQTRLGLGYARAARIVGNMEQKGYIGPFDSTTKKRRIIITKEEFLEMKVGKADKQDEE